jgi:hypothetical protein
MQLPTIPAFSGCQLVVYGKEGSEPVIRHIIGWQIRDAGTPYPITADGVFDSDLGGYDIYIDGQKQQ